MAGTEAAELLLAKVMATPEGPAGLPSVTVPVEVDPPCTLNGLRLNPLSAAGLTVIVAVWLMPGAAEIVPTIWLSTGSVVTANVVLVFPAGTVIEVGTVT